MGWLWAIAVAFLFVHVVAAIVCERTSRTATGNSTPEAICMSCD
jgi:hypothetical protein